VDGDDQIENTFESIQAATSASAISSHGLGSGTVALTFSHAIICVSNFKYLTHLQIDCGGCSKVVVILFIDIKILLHSEALHFTIYNRTWKIMMKTSATIHSTTSLLSLIQVELNH
jgi:hypothetical protein